MKRFFLPLVLIIASATLSAQIKEPTKTDKNSDVYQLGTKTVRIPVPVGFTDVTGRIENDRNVFQRYDADGENMTYVSDEIVGLLQANPRTPLGLHAKGWIPANRRTTDITTEYFGHVVSGMEQNFATIIDPKSETMKKAKDRAKSFAAQNLDPNATVDFNQTTNLGFIQKSDHVFSAMAFLSAQVNGQQATTLITFSVLRLNDRLVWIYCYALSPTEKDFETLPEFTKIWTAAIVAANSKPSGQKKR